MMQDLEKQTMALAGLFQCCAQVRQLAWFGTHDPEQLDTAVYSIFQQNAESVEQVYSGLKHLLPGLRILCAQLDGRFSEREFEVTQYVTNILYLERKFTSQSDVGQRLGAMVSEIHTKVDRVDWTTSATLSDLANTYQTVVSPLGTKIIVSGEQRFLADQKYADLVRVFLLAALRSAVLWRQCGGKRLALIWRRRHYLNAARQLARTS